MAKAQIEKDEPIIIKKIIKKVAGHGHHGGAWKVAYADFVTAMMCLFLLLWLINVDPSAKSAVANFFKQPTQTGPMQGNVFIFGGAKRPGNPGKMEGGASFLEFQKLVLSGQNKKEIQSKMKNDLQKQLEISSDEKLLNKVEFNLVEQGILIEIKDDENMEVFPSGSAALTGEARALIDKVANVIKNKISSIVVAGHTDSKDFSYGNYDNWNLSTDRAIAIKTRLIYDGVNQTRFARVEGYADSQLKDPELPLAAANRRITILLLQDGEEKNLKPKYLDEQVSFGKEVKAARKRESEKKQSGNLSIKEYGASAGRSHKPLSLDELKRQKARQSFRKRHPTGTGSVPAAGGHGEEASSGHEAPPAPSGGGDGGGH
ncbi:MAG: OmpA family protein [Candidatus Melainabacteria bacterium]|jgi:chemotaxis protein MotB|nr:OmpA family protein [Candidatus Melainabacteria bacterium]